MRTALEKVVVSENKKEEKEHDEQSTNLAEVHIDHRRGGGIFPNRSEPASSTGGRSPGCGVYSDDRESCTDQTEMV